MKKGVLTEVILEKSEMTKLGKFILCLQLASLIVGSFVLITFVVAWPMIEKSKEDKCQSIRSEIKSQEPIIIQNGNNITITLHDGLLIRDDCLSILVREPFSNTEEYQKLSFIGTGLSVLGGGITVLKELKKWQQRKITE